MTKTIVPTTALDASDTVIDSGRLLKITDIEKGSVRHWGVPKPVVYVTAVNPVRGHQVRITANPGRRWQRIG